jgi:hypothetical protein
MADGDTILGNLPDTKPATLTEVKAFATDPNREMESFIFSVVNWEGDEYFEDDILSNIGNLPTVCKVKQGGDGGAKCVIAGLWGIPESDFEGIIAGLQGIFPGKAINLAFFDQNGDFAETQLG